MLTLHWFTLRLQSFHFFISQTYILLSPTNWEIFPQMHPTRFRWYDRNARVTDWTTWLEIGTGCCFPWPIGHSSRPAWFHTRNYQNCFEKSHLALSVHDSSWLVTWRHTWTKCLQIVLFRWTPKSPTTTSIQPFHYHGRILFKQRFGLFRV